MKKCRKVRNRVLCCLLAALLLLELFAPDCQAQTPRSETLNLQNEEALLDRMDLPQGGMTVPLTFSDQEIAEREMSPQELLDYAGIDEADALQAEREMETDLMSASAEPVSSNTCAKSEVLSVSDNTAPQEQTISPETLGYATVEDAVSYLRKQMVKRRSYITLRLAKGNDTAQRRIKTILQHSIAYDETCSPSEGDYLYWNFKMYHWSLMDSTSETVTYAIVISWRTDEDEEKYVTQKVARIIEELDLKNTQKSDYEKVRQIYTYIMDHVTYDYYHYTTDQSYAAMYTAYTALHDGTGVCQAYALVFYRLCQENGIPARLIAGNDENGSPTHGWNIVRIGEYYYNVDATWDDETASGNVYFLKNQADFSGHTRNKAYTGAAFEKAFPTSPVSYSVPDALDATEATGVFAEKDNLTGTLQTMSGETFSLDAQGCYKILIFLNPAENGSVKALDHLASYSFLGQADCQIAVIDVMSNADYANYMAQKGVTGYSVGEYEKKIGEAALKYIGKPNNVVYVLPSDDAINLQKQYAALMGGTAGSICCGVVIDPANKVRYWCEGGTKMDGIQSAMNLLQKKTEEILPAGKITLTQSANNKVSVKWNALGGAKRYYIYRKNGTGDYACVGTTDRTSYVNTIPGKGSYTYVVYAADDTQFFAAYDETVIRCKTLYPKKGKTYQAGGCKYKVLKSSASARTVAFAGMTSKKSSSVRIPDSVEIDGLTYKVTEIAGGALRGKTNLRTVSIGKNVTKIGKNAFYGCKKLVQIVVQGNKIKSVGTSAFRGISKSANVYVPKAALGKYKKLFSGKGLSENAKIRK